MVFKPFTHLARPSFSKAFNHGYAQSVVAATQSSYASSTTPYPRSNKVGRPQTAQLHTALQNVSSQPHVPAKAGLHTAECVERRGGDPNLQGYYEALWRRQHAGEEAKEWTQFQFAKRIEWDPPSVVPKGSSGEGADAVSRRDALRNRGNLDRAYSTSAVDDIKKVEDEIAEATALAKVNDAIAQVVTKIHDAPDLRNTPRQQLESIRSEDGENQIPNDARRAVPNDIDARRAVEPLSVLQVESSTLEKSILPEEISSPESIPVVTSSPRSITTEMTSVADPDSYALSEHINKLHGQQLYSQIPSVFEAMVVQGITPSVKNYNALLAAAIHHPDAKHQVAPKALNIYSDMLRRKVDPDTAFYSSLIELLASRSLDVIKMKDALNMKRLRCAADLRNRDGFLFSSNSSEYEILLQDKALSNAIQIFQTSVSGTQTRHYSADLYRLIVTACALHNNLDDMISTYKHLESHNIIPMASMFPPMIKAFARNRELICAVDCYNGYKSLAVADDAGELALIGRDDNEIYAAVVKAYAMCGKIKGGNRFIAKIVDSLADVTVQRREKLEAVHDSVILNALIEDRISAMDYGEALKIAKEQDLTPFARIQAMTQICITAADHDKIGAATQAFHYLPYDSRETSAAALSLLSFHTRQGDLDAARETWIGLSKFDQSAIEPTTVYAILLIRNGHVDEALVQAREKFAHIRATTADSNSKNGVSEEIDEAIEVVGAFMARHGVKPSANGSMSLLWAMIENGGLVTPVAEHILAGLGPDDIANFSQQDIILALQVEAGLMDNARSTQDGAHSARFAHLLDIAMSSEGHFDERTTGLIEKAIVKFSPPQPNLVSKWQNRQKVSSLQSYERSLFSPQSPIAVSSQAPFTDSYDPYAATTDYKGSSIIAEELENRRNGAGLNEALLRFRNIRRAGRHPRYIAYAKLITAAAKEGRTNLIQDIIGMARTDMPLLHEYSVVRHGWSTILDSMVGACLTVGRRRLAAEYHQEMLDIGTVPTANTFGLYITTLKDSTKTFDEASEAVAIFGRAMAEGVVPSSFLYNALIGKLGKARRIDDCLRYFQEMRASGIRPTSVTYGTVVNALCRVSDDRFAEELFDEMESMPNYKPRPAPYNSLMQFFLTTKRDSQKVLSYYHRMQARNIQPTMHTYKLLIDTYATLEPVNLAAAEGVLDTIRASGQHPEAVHYAALIHAKGCALHDMDGARRIFNEVLAHENIRPQACLYQALFESMVANHCVEQTTEMLDQMYAHKVDMTPYIANTLIHGWAMESDITKSKAIFDDVGLEKREPSTYEAMTRAFLTARDRDGALTTAHEMLSRGYPAAVSSKILELVGHGTSRAGGIPP